MGHNIAHGAESHKPCLPLDFSMPRNAASNTPSACPPEIRCFPSATTAGAALTPRAPHLASGPRMRGTSRQRGPVTLRVP